MNMNAKFPNHNDIAYIDLSSWTMFGGEHYNVRVNIDYDFNDYIEYPMTSRQAIEFNKKDGCNIYRKGMMTKRFWTESAAIKAGIKFVHEKYPKCRLIVRGDIVTLDPVMTVWCVIEPMVDQLNDIWRKLETFYKNSSNPFLLHEEEMENISAQWWNLVKKIHN